MGKIYCPCGGLIPDNGDWQPWKAYLLADEDWGRDDSLEQLLEKKSPILQCEQCGRITFYDPLSERLLWFVPEGRTNHCALSAVPSGILLRAWWYPERSEGWIQVGSGPDEHFVDRSTMRQRFEGELERLRSEGVLRWAYIEDGDELTEYDPQGQVIRP